MVDEGPERLILERGDSRVQLVAASGIRPARHEDVAIGPGERDVVDGRNGAPDVYERFGGRLVRSGVDELDIGGQRQSDPDEPVPAERGEVIGLRAMYAEVVGVDWPEKRIVGIRVELAAELERSEEHTSELQSHSF